MNWLDEIDGSWTLFLDRDGVINRRLVDDYVTSVDEFELIPGVAEALYLMKDTFYKIIVVTNQQGIGKDIMSHDDLRVVHQHMIGLIANAHGSIDQVYYSPDLAYLNSTTRKPAPGMALQAQLDFPYLDFEKSIIVGDSPSDMQFGQNLGMKKVWHLSHEAPYADVDLTIESLLQFAKLVAKSK